MAAIPIEVVIRDAGDPVTPDTPENPVVPNTSGAGDAANGKTGGAPAAPYTATGEGYTTKMVTKDSGELAGGLIGGSATVSIVSIVAAMLVVSLLVVLIVRRCRAKKTFSMSGTSRIKVATVAIGAVAMLAGAFYVGQLVDSQVVQPMATHAADANSSTSLVTTDKISIEIVREDDGTMVASTLDKAYATTDAALGYQVTAAMVGNTANLYLNGDTASQYYIGPTANAGLGDNTWGYSVAIAEGYQAMPVVGSEVTIAQGDGPVTSEEVAVHYAARVDDTLPAGTYMGEVEYTIEGIDTTSAFPSTLTTMQGMTTKICESVTTPSKNPSDPVPTATLTDTRDGKTYTIAKLADGHCWMTQNLDLDLSTEVTLTPEDTNITDDWTPSSNTISFGGIDEGFVVGGWEDSTTAPYSAGSDDVYFYTSGNNSYDVAYGSLANCKAAGHTDCSYYHAGNYYNWSAAVASNNTSALTDEFENAETSICPAGWRLPRNMDGITYTEGNEQFEMVSSYNGILGTQSGGSGGPSYTYVEGGFNTLRANPLRLVRSGNVSNEFFEAGGEQGEFWSSTIGGENSAYILEIDSRMFRPTFGETKVLGISVRCVAQ